MEEKPCIVKLENRKTLNLNGILEVVSFLENRAEMQSVEGLLIVCGEGLHMERLDLEKGEVLVTGRVDAIDYLSAEKPSKKGLFQKLFS